MREILFKAQRIYNNKWVEGYLAPFSGLDYKTKERFVIKTGILDSYEVYCESFCQFTGLTDKNGTKIFEGDIIRIYWNDYYSEETITYDTKYGYYMYGNNPICELIGDNEFEVIGNVFDLHELLK